MHEIYVAALVELFYQSLETWSREEPTVTRNKAIYKWLIKRDPQALVEAMLKIEEGL